MATFIVAGIVAAVSSAATLQTEDFSSGQGGWTSGGATVSLEPTGGPAGAGDPFVRVQPGFANLAAFNSSPDWIGDYAAVGATHVEVDLRAAPGTSPLSIRLVLFGPGTQPPTTATTQYTSTVAAEIPADGQWRHAVFSLAEADLTRVRGTEPHDALMGNVLRVMLRHDPGTPSSGGASVNGDLGVDNVALAGPAATAGDYNGDQKIDGSDFVLWQRGESPLPRSAADLSAWEANYGQVAPSLRLVPEPATGAGLAWLVVMAACRRKAGSAKPPSRPAVLQRSTRPSLEWRLTSNPPPRSPGMRPCQLYTSHSDFEDFWHVICAAISPILTPLNSGREIAA